MVDVISVYLNVFIATTCHGRYQSCKYDEGVLEESDMSGTNLNGFLVKN